jgi:DNA-binding XRE family transcriptional regulator
MNNYRKIELYLKEDTVKRIENLTKYKNIDNTIIKNVNEEFNVEDFILGTVYHYLKTIEFKTEYEGVEKLVTSRPLRNKFKEIAEKKNINQRQMAELTGIDPAGISHVFRNRNQPSLDAFLRIWVALGCPPLNKCLYREES